MTAVLEERKEGAAAPSTFDYDVLRLASRTLDDFEHARIQGRNRIGALARRRKIPEEVAELGLPQDALVAFGALDTAEAAMIEAIENLWAEHPLAPWAESIKGVGPKTIARLIAEIGDPLWRPVGHWEGEDEKREWIVDDYVPRTLAQLRAYAGHGDPARKRTRGMSQEDAFGMGNPLVKKRLWLIADGGKKATCPNCRADKRERKAANDGKAVSYAPPPPDCTCAETHVLRHVYTEARAKYATRLETEGTRVGEPWRPARQEAAALREVGKYFLRMLHAEATRLA